VNQSLEDFFVAGGPFMAVIAAVAVAALAVALERIHFYFIVCRGRPEELVATTAAALNEGRSGAALEGFAGSRAPTATLLRGAVRRHLEGASPEQIETALEEDALREIPRLGKRVDDLGVLANVATLTGLLGTIFGLQESFTSLGIADAAEKAAVLAGGISQAMNTTAFGLLVAIPCLLAHSKLSARRNQLAEELDAATLRFLNYLRIRAKGSHGPHAAEPLRLDEVRATAGDER
jgi:biopolymer transport protein ExbB